MKNLVYTTVLLSISAMALNPQAELYKNTSKNSGYLIIVPNGNGYTINGIYSKKDNPKKTRYWESQCEKVNETQLKCVFNHRFGYHDSGTMTLEIKEDNKLYAVIESRDGHKSKPVYERVLPEA